MSVHPAIRIAITVASLSALTTPSHLAAQTPPGQPLTGPVIQSSGSSYKVDNPTFAVPEGQVFKAVWVINTGGGDTSKVNEQLNTISRFYNIHVRHGYAEQRLHGAAVFHGTGWTALLTDSAFAARYGGSRNPSRKLVEELLQHGARLVLCGQTAGARGIRREELLPGVQVAVSAMTAMMVLEGDGYRFISW